MYDRILIAVAGSDEAAHAARRGLKREFLDRLEATGQAAVDSVVDEIRSTVPDLEIETAIERTTSFNGAAEGIREYVERTEIDLVVMSSHGRSNLTRQLLGSVAATVLRAVDVPVLVVPRTSRNESLGSRLFCRVSN